MAAGSASNSTWTASTSTWASRSRRGTRSGGWDWSARRRRTCTTSSCTTPAPTPPRKGTDYVLCRKWGDEVRVGAAYNHWWLLTDLDEVTPGGRGRAYVSAYYLDRWGNDEAKDNDGLDIPACT